MLFWIAPSVLIFLGIVVSYAWYVKAYIRTYYYDGEEDFVTIRKGVFAPTEIHVQYQKIQDVYVDQDLLDRMMGLYDVHIASATFGSAMEAHIDGVDAQTAEGLKNFFLNKMRGVSGTLVSGGAGDQAASMSQAPILQAIKPSWSERIAIDTFPISQKWVVLKAVAGAWHGIWLGIIFSFYASIPGKHSDSSLADDLGWDFGQTVAIAVWIVVVYIVLYSIYTVIWKRNYAFEFSPDYIFVRSGVISRQEQHVPYATIQDVIVNQSFWERIFGMATVVIQNATGGQMMPGALGLNAGVQIPGQTLDRANRISQALKDQVLSRRVASQSGL
jgi:putative membrane protein